MIDRLKEVEDQMNFDGLIYLIILIILIYLKNNGKNHVIRKPIT
jgi:hypothetical protein